MHGARCVWARDPPKKLPQKCNLMKIDIHPSGGWSPSSLSSGRRGKPGGWHFTPTTYKPILRHHRDPAAFWVAQRGFAG